MKIVIFTAHPADSVIGVGGTVARYAEEGHQVIDICATMGQALRPDMDPEEVGRIREEERRRAAKILGYTDVRNMGYRDTELPYNRKIVGEITEIIRAEKPDIVMTYWWQNVHPDLRNLSMAVSDATIFAAFYYPSKLPAHHIRKLYQFSSLNSINWDPEFYIDITDYIEKKRQALNEFRLVDELIRKWEGPGSKGLADQIISQNRHYGLYSQVPYAEAFREFFGVEIKSRALKFLPI
ncbi:MAG: PIG-L deacetylase family protein [Candidatus Bathyarchaeia archaeon]